MTSLWFGTSLSRHHEAVCKFDHMSLKSWGLSNRTLNALLSFDFKMTVGDVIRADEDFTSISGLGEAGIRELSSKVSLLFAEVQKIEAGLSTDQSTIPLNPRESVDLPLKILPQSAQNLPLDQLHLEVKTHEVLVKAGIATVGELYNISSARLSAFRGFHPDSLGNINDSIVALLNSVNDEDKVDWFEYWKLQQIQVLPTTSTFSTPSEQIVEELPMIIDEFLRRDLDDRSGIIIKRRYGLGNVEKLTLEDIGNAFGGISRERIRQLEERALKRLQDSFIEQHYAGKNYHIHPAIHLMLQTIRGTIESEPSKLILETKLLEHVGQTLNIDVLKVRSSLLLILPLMSIERVEFDYPNSVPAWGYVDSTKRNILDNGIKRLDDLLTSHTPLPQTEFDILVLLNKKAKKSEKLSLAQLSWLINLCNTVERREDGSIWGKFEYLKGRGNQVERLLSESGIPMSIADLAREINHRLVPLGQRRIVERNLSNQIIGDGRFVAIGRSGKWGLKSWSHIDTKSIMILMEEYFITRNKPASVDEIYTYVSERRPVSRHSIIMYLTYEKLTFVKTGHTTWGLAEWSDVTGTGLWNQEQVADFIANIYKNNKAKELSYKMLKEALMKEAGINAKQAQGLLNFNPVIKTRSEKAWGERTAVFQPNYKAVLAQVKSHTSPQKVSLRRQVEVCAHDILRTTPDNQMPMKELAHQLHKQLEASITTVYNYLNSMESIERIDVSNSHIKMCRLKEAHSTVSEGTLRHNVSISVRAILEVAPNKQMSLSELIVQLRKQYSCPKATLYQYIADLDYIERLSIPHSQSKICRIRETQKLDLFPQVKTIVDGSLREKVERTLPFLTEENVDIGLFLLSKEFESTLKVYILKTSTMGKLSVLPPGKTPANWNLSGMVDCARDNGIISDHATFHYLRQARNDRAHGTMPSLAERQLLMKSIQYIAGLYIDYIKLLDDLTQSL